MRKRAVRTGHVIARATSFGNIETLYQSIATEGELLSAGLAGA